MQSFIFDFNGTLFLDLPLHRVAWERFMARRGIAVTDEMFYRYMFGPPNDAILRRFIRPDLTAEEIAALSREKEALYREMVCADPRLRALAPGAAEMLDMLKARGVPCAIATGSIRDNVDFYMHTLGIDRWFDYDHIFYDEGDLPGKPDPAIYLQAMTRLGYRPEETTVVEDALSGIQSAAAAGVGRIIAIDATLGREALEHNPNVAAIIHDYHHFDRFIDREERA